MPTPVERPEDLTIDLVGPIELAPSLLEQLRKTRAQALRVLATESPVYGVNTGMGALSKVRLDEDEQRVHQRNLLLGRAVGGAPWLPYAESRAVVVARLRTFLTGDAGVSAELCAQLVALLNSGFAPAIPVGGAGSAGEIIPLAHAFGPLVGVGSVVDAEDKVRLASSWRRTASSFELGPKEGIALLAGIPGATGRAWLQIGVLERLLDRMGEVAAGAIAVVAASRDPYDPRTGRADALLAAEQARILQLAGTESNPSTLQAPISFRVVGHVVSHARRMVAELAAAVDRGLDGVTDSPALLGRDFVGTAGFHGIDLAAHCDHVVAALAHAAEVSAARLHRLLDPAVSGLPAQLARVPGPQAGLVPVHKRAVATVHALRRLTLPTAIGAMETSNGQEDVQTFCWEAVGGLGEAIRLTREVAAGELLAVHQAFALSGRPVPAGLRDLLDAVADVVPPIGADRPFGLDLQRILDTVL
ncbi:phenylalanine/histidine ammonia-lyase [Kribbella flavida DSM 17836]|uniref:Phenylalanine/histidine ammonia-lyase n=1 Tax=Kribbella flavida (strain DSM 17836 / JCM 10339 / NBRC 14399) TaxID=479435 RepID=D2PZZ2_KRIFD|nr:aromatic amino acid lyase [Kribbella flavida]ADB29990.1 phenylalanine/histidine ammonia-lyase [Kribbella flavida DSM 17836]